MFGYVTPFKMELKIKDYEKFKAYYCGLCHEIKANFGELPRMSLNYDMTFIAVLFDALSSDKTIYEPFKCALHPTKKKVKAVNVKALNYASFLNVSLFYYKMLDDVYDDKSIKAKIISIILKKSKNKFVKDYPYINDKIKEELNNLNTLESSNDKCIDEIAHPFASLTGFLFKNYPYKLFNDSMDLREDLYALGYNLGKWIYIIDALDDLKDDMKKDKYNALNSSMNKDRDSFEVFFYKEKERIKFILLSCASQCCDIIKKINFVKDIEIINNILFYGIMDKNLKILSKYDPDNNIKQHEGVL